MSKASVSAFDSGSGETHVTNSMISLRNIEKFFEHGPTKTYVLRRINIDIKDGEFISIMGPSGAGKSTLDRKSVV